MRRRGCHLRSQRSDAHRDRSEKKIRERIAERDERFRHARIEAKLRKITTDKYLAWHPPGRVCPERGVSRRVPARRGVPQPFNGSTALTVFPSFRAASRRISCSTLVKE